MGQGKFIDDLKLDSIKQITERGHCVADVSMRLGVCTHSLYSWMKRYAVSPTIAVKDDQAAEAGAGVRHRGTRCTKNATTYFTKDATLTPM
jgi:transposase